MPIHLIFEGAELSGKSYLMSRLYTQLESEHFTSPNILDGCIWINSDVGVFGGEHGPSIVLKYVEIAEELKEKNLMFEKLQISDKAYQKIYNGIDLDYSKIEERLNKLNFKIVFTTFREDPELIKKRLSDRLALYPHYERIKKAPDFYIEQQRAYRELVKESALPCFEIDMSEIVDKSSEILSWANS